MSSGRSSTRSIAARLVVLFTLSAVLLLCSGLGLLYWIVIRHAFEEDNEVLADKLFAMRANLEAAGGPQSLQEEVTARRAGERVAYFVRVLDEENRTVVETPGLAGTLPPHVFLPTTTKPRDFRAAGRLFTLVTSAQAVNGRTFTLQVAQDRSEDAKFTLRFGALLIAVLGCGVVASAIIARYVARTGLRPLTQMTESLERVRPTHMSERLDPQAWPRELQPVALAFDHMLDRLEESFTRLSQFSADLAHELRTPIANMRGETEVTLTRPRSAEEYREVLESTLAECVRLSVMIDNLLFLARAEAAERHVERTRFDGRAAIEKIASYYETVAEERNVAIACSGSGEIEADPVLFDRAVGNLVDNALRFTPEGGKIEIAISPSAVSVRDSGSGIAPEHLPRVFDRFYRADQSRSSEGTGLGLSLVKSIAELHGGNAKVESEPGRGTTVTVSFR